MDALEHVSALSRRKNPCTLTTLSKDPYSFDFELFGRPSPKLLTVDMVLAECKQLTDFPVMSKTTLGKLCKIFDFSQKCRNKKCTYINDLMLILCS